MAVFAVLASLGPLSRIPEKRETRRVETQRSRARKACRVVQAESPTRSDLQAARDAFADDKQIAVVLQAERAAAAVGMASESDALRVLRQSCSDLYLHEHP
jgi:hypothetical protein